MDSEKSLIIGGRMTWEGDSNDEDDNYRSDAHRCDKRAFYYLIRPPSPDLLRKSHKLFGDMARESSKH